MYEYNIHKRDTTYYTSYDFAYIYSIDSNVCSLAMYTVDKNDGKYFSYKDATRSKYAAHTTGATLLKLKIGTA